jgi:hypothetical protein
MFCYGFRGKSMKKSQQQGDDDKIEEMDMVVNKENMGQLFHNMYMMKFKS